MPATTSALSERSASAELDTIPKIDLNTRLSLSLPELSAATGIGMTLLYDMIADGRLKRVKVGRRSVVPISEARRLVGEDHRAA